MHQLPGHAPQDQRWPAASGVAGDEVKDVGQLEQTRGSHHVVEHVVVRQADAPVMPRVPAGNSSVQEPWAATDYHVTVLINVHWIYRWYERELR